MPLEHPGVGRPQIVALCGSTRFWTQLAEANLRETAAGRIVLAPGCNLKEPHELWATPAQAEQLKPLLDALHLQKIDLADEVLVVNPGGYIGDSTRSEITYAHSLGKPVRYLEETRHAVLLARPGHTDLRLGPYDTHGQADSIAAGLRGQLPGTTHVPGTTITTVPYDVALPHSEPYIPTNPDELADRMDDDEEDAGKETAFPDLFARLHAQLGYERARDVWLQAAATYDWIRFDPDDDTPQG